MAQSKFENKIRHTKLELDQHIQIMQLQGERVKWKAKYDELKAELDELKQCKKGAFKLIEKQTQDYAALQQQHQQLKEKAEKMIDLLDIATSGRVEPWSVQAGQIVSAWKEGEQKEYNQAKDGEALARTIVAIAEEVSKDAESAEAYLKSEGVDVENPGLYPEVFQPMQWWEDRKVEDYPAFLKTKNGEVRKINQIVTEESDDPFYTTEEDELGWYFHQDGVIPATEQEYLEYIKQKEG